MATTQSGPTSRDRVLRAKFNDKVVEELRETIQQLGREANEDSTWTATLNVSLADDGVEVNSREVTVTYDDDVTTVENA